MTNTTFMKDSTIGDNWIREMCELNPIQACVDPATGQPNGLYLSGPVRLSFPHLIDPAPANPNSKFTRTSDVYEATLLFPPQANIALLEQWLDEVNRANFKDKINPQTGQLVGIKSPIHPCDDKFKYSGYTSGLKYMRISSQFKPGVFDSRQQPITDKNKVYPGVWAIVAMNAYASGLKNQDPTAVKQARFGIANVMIIGDDSNLGAGGSAPPASSTFGGVNVRAPATSPSAAFGQMPPAGQQAPQQTGHNATPQFGGAYGQQHVDPGQQQQFQPVANPNTFA